MKIKDIKHIPLDMGDFTANFHYHNIYSYDNKPNKLFCYWDIKLGKQGIEIIFHDDEAIN